MTKLAILDSKLITQEVEKTERTNILLSRGKVIGIGYIPDDEDCEKLQANGYYTIRTVTSFNLNYSQDELSTAKEAGITQWLQTSDTAQQTPFCTSELDPNHQDLINQAETTQTSCLVALQSANSKLLNTTYTHTSFSLPSSEVINNTRESLSLLIKKTATHIHLTPPFTPNSIFEIHEALKSTFSLRDIAAFLSHSAWKYLEKTPESVSLLKSPSFTLFSPEKTPRILGTFLDGEPVVQK